MTDWKYTVEVNNIRDKYYYYDSHWIETHLGVFTRLQSQNTEFTLGVL